MGAAGLMSIGSAARDLWRRWQERRDERAETRRQLWCEGQSLAGETRNVSRKGMFIVADPVPEVGERLSISFRDGEIRDVEIDTEVMWHGHSVVSERPGMGVRIVGFKKGEAAYERFVSRHLAKGSSDDSSGE